MYAKAGIQSAPGQRHSISSAGTVSTQPDTDDEEGLGSSHKSDFDYFGAATTQQVLNFGCKSEAIFRNIFETTGLCVQQNAFNMF